MKRVVGNIWNIEGDWRVIPTNGYINKKGECVMGRGLALQAKLRYPRLPFELGVLIEMSGNRVFLLRPHKLISFPVKPVWWVKASTEMVEESCEQLVQVVNDSEETNVLIPLVGCGNGKLHRSQVLPVLEKYLDDRFILVEYKS